MRIDCQRINLKSMQWQNSLLLRTVSSLRTNEYSKNLFCPVCAGKTLLALSTSRIVCQDKVHGQESGPSKKTSAHAICSSYLGHLSVSPSGFRCCRLYISWLPFCSCESVSSFFMALGQRGTCFFRCMLIQHDVSTATCNMGISFKAWLKMHLKTQKKQSCSQIGKEN